MSFSPGEGVARVRWLRQRKGCVMRYSATWSGRFAIGMMVTGLIGISSGLVQGQYPEEYTSLPMTYGPVSGNASSGGGITNLTAAPTASQPFPTNAQGTVTQRSAPATLPPPAAPRGIVPPGAVQSLPTMPPAVGAGARSGDLQPLPLSPLLPSDIPQTNSSPMNPLETVPPEMVPYVESATRTQTAPPPVVPTEPAVTGTQPDTGVPAARLNPPTVMAPAISMNPGTLASPSINSQGSALVVPANPGPAQTFTNPSMMLAAPGYYGTVENGYPMGGYPNGNVQNGGYWNAGYASDGCVNNAYPPVAQETAQSYVIWDGTGSWNTKSSSSSSWPSIPSFLSGQAGPGVPTPDAFIFSGPPQDGRFWGGVDSLFWFISGSGNHVPALVTRQYIPSSSRVAVGEEIPESVGTLARSEVVYGDRGLGDDLRYGFRLNLGMWMTPYQNIGVQVDWFTLGADHDSYSHFETYASNSGMALARPFHNWLTGADDRVMVAYPYSDAERPVTPMNNFVYRIGDPMLYSYAPNGDPAGKGGVDVEARSYFDGGSAAMRFRIFRDCEPNQIKSVDLLAGYQCLRYDSNFSIWQDSDHNRLSVDSFDARNIFNGGLLGLAAESRQSNWTFTAGARLGFGAMNRRMNIDGNTYTWSDSEASPDWVKDIFIEGYEGWASWGEVADVADTSKYISDILHENGVTSDQIRGGMLTSPTNMGEYHQQLFTVIPMVNVGAAYRWNRYVSTNLGYEVMYLGRVWTAVGAVPEEIDSRNIPQGGDGATNVPSFSGKSKELWIQGLNAGIQVEF